MQELATEVRSTYQFPSMYNLLTWPRQAAWGTIWTRPGLELKQRSLIVIALLASQGKEAEVCLRRPFERRVSKNLLTALCAYFVRHI